MIRFGGAVSWKGLLNWLENHERLSSFNPRLFAWVFNCSNVTFEMIHKSQLLFFILNWRQRQTKKLSPGTFSASEFWIIKLTEIPLPFVGRIPNFPLCLFQRANILSVEKAWWWWRKLLQAMKLVDETFLLFYSQILLMVEVNKLSHFYLISLHFMFITFPSFHNVHRLRINFFFRCYHFNIPRATEIFLLIMKTLHCCFCLHKKFSWKYLFSFYESVKLKLLLLYYTLVRKTAFGSRLWAVW